ncbi:sensor domain-containing protein [Dactylosporangium roseum]|uniref:histidine kinase n=1 Tax=Dactylosporangium roseum TaxID=47989 RepID=A0ABY5ZD04_9ACTN|nr:sensor histidine kinase [Dactylosporangium roseum]UWZ39451.1 sensor domain-containing protein [Dactylosporangium roseum]
MIDQPSRVGNLRPAAQVLIVAGRAVVARQSLKGLAYLLLTVPLDLVSGILLLAGGVLSTILLITPLGTWLLALILRTAAGLGRLRLALAHRLRDERVPAPPRPTVRGGVFGWRRAMLTDPAGWRALAYTLAKLPVAIPSLLIGGGCYGYGLTMLTYVPLQEHPPEPWAIVGSSLAGLVLLLVAPWMLRSVLAVERMLIRGLLGPSQAAQRLADLRETRDQAVSDAHATLRRIERDLHDGAQAQLIGVGMHLTMIRELVAADAPPEHLRAAVDTAQDALTATVTQLRDLIRGIHPPVLDRGLHAALTTVAAGSPVSVTVSVDLPRRPPPAVESIAYFCACELLTNVGKHSAARTATLRIALRDGVLRIRTSDDGRGGAFPRAGGGLAGLAERIRVVDGRMVISSPPAGPTVVTVEIPCPGTGTD